MRHDKADLTSPELDLTAGGRMPLLVLKREPSYEYVREEDER